MLYLLYLLLNKLNIIKHLLKHIKIHIKINLYAINNFY